MDATSYAKAVTEGESVTATGKNEVGIEGSGSGLGRHPSDSVGRLLEGYYHRMNLAIGAFLVYRTITGSAVVYALYKLWKRRQMKL